MNEALNPKNASSTSKDQYMKTLHATTHQSYAELTFDVYGLSKPANALSSPLARIVDNLQQFDPPLRGVNHKVAVNQVKDQVAVEIDAVTKEISSFVNNIRDHFHDVRTKGKDGGKIFTKF